MKQSPATDTELDQSQKSRHDSDAIVWQEGIEAWMEGPWGEGAN